MKIISCFLLLWTAAVSGSGATLVWTNTAGGNWSTAENWSPNQVPAVADDVSITNAGTYTVAVHNPAVARSINLGGNGGRQTLTMPGAPLVVSNAITIGPSGLFQALGTLNAFGDVVVNGEFQALGVVLGGSGVLDVTGGAQLNLLSDLRVANRVLRNSGTVLIADGHQLFLGDDARFTNFASGTLILTNNNSGIQYNGNFPNTNQFFDNQGLIRAHGNSFIDVPSAHSGTIEVIAGELSLRRNANYSSFAVDVTALCNVSAGATLAFENAVTEFRPPASASGSGSLRVSGGNFNLTGSYTLAGTLVCHNNALVHLNTGSPLTLSNLWNDIGADVRGSDPLTITGTLLWRNGAKFSGPAPLLLAASCQTTFERSGTEMHRPFMANAGTMNWIAADLVLGTNSVFTNLATGTIVVTNNEFGTITFIRQFGPDSTFHNLGLIRLNSDNRIECSIPFFNTGTLRAERGEFRVTFSAPFKQSAGATELAGGNLFSFQGSSYQFLGGTLTGSGSIIGGDVTNSGAVVSPGASPGRLNITFANPGTLGRYEQLAGGALNIDLAGTTPGTEFDQIVMDGNAVLGGTLNVTVADGFNPPVGTRFLIVSAGARTGQFSTFNYPSNQIELQVSYLPNGVELVVGTPGEQVFLVRNLNDSGPGSLRAAVGAANVGAAPLRKVHFAITNPPPYTITLATPITVLDRTLIDGTTQAGFVGAPMVTVRGLSGVTAMRFWGTNSAVRALAFTDFTHPALQLGEPGFPFGDANAVEGCYFGVDATGTNVTAIGLADPQRRTYLLCVGDGNRIGGTNAAARNLFAGPSGSGVLLFGASNLVQGNFFGTDITGTNRLGELSSGVTYDGLSALIGGTEPGAGNVFAFLTFHGVTVHAVKEGCTIRGNSMFSNGSLGISTGASENDPGDIDTFPGNDGQNFPVITGVQNQVTNTLISGSLHSQSNSVFLLDFYASAECDPSGHGEGSRYLGFTQVMTDASGNASFTFIPTIGSPILDATAVVTATATDPAGNTSEFSECSGISSSIGGQITESDMPLSGGTVHLFGVRTATTNTDVNGNFAFPNLPAFGAYTVVPSKPGYVFTPQSQSFSNLNSPGLANFSFAVGAYSISGLVRDRSGNAIAGARVALTGGNTQNVATDSRGAYAFTRLPGLSNYTLSVSKAEFSFGPPTNIINLTGNRKVDFTGTPPPRHISGHVQTAGGQPVAGVTVQVFPFTSLLPGRALQTVQTDPQGLFQFLNLPSNQRYLVRPSSSQFLFTLQSATLLLANTDLAADFIATSGHRITGRVTDGPAGFPGVTLQFTIADTGELRGSAITDTNGQYRSPLLADGADYEIRATSTVAAGAFTPETHLVLNLPGDVSGKDFSGDRQNFEILGHVLNNAGLATPQVSVALSGSAIDHRDDVFGTFSFFKPGAGSYTISPSRAGFLFAPSNIVINPLTNHQQIQFHATPVLPLTGRIAFVNEIPLVMNADSTGVPPEGIASESADDFDFCVSACGDDPFDLDELLDGFESSQSLQRDYLAVALSPDSRQFAYIERATLTINPAVPLEPTITEVQGRLLKRNVDRLSPPVVLAEGTFLPKISWAANGARIAYARAADDQFAAGLYVISPDGTAGTIVSGIGANPRDPALSPDGNRIAFVAELLGQDEIFVVNVNGTGLIRLTTHSGDDIEPAWSPSGQSIAYASKRSGNFEIVIVDVQTGQDFGLTSNSVDDREPAWSPDGTRIAFTRGGIIHVKSVGASSTEIPLRRGSSPSWGTDPTYVTPASPTLGQDVTINAGAIDVTFNSVTSAGDTTVTAISALSDPTLLPEGYFGLGGTDFAFDITTTAGFLAPITICLHLETDDESLFNQLSILHNENGQLQDVTVSRNFPTRQICGAVNSLSPFRLAIKIDPALPLITGTVVDSSGGPVPNVLVALGGSTPVQTSTDYTGKFTFGNLAIGSNYTVTVLDSRYDFIPPTAFVQELAGLSSLVFAATTVAPPTLTVSPDLQNPGAFHLAWPLQSWSFVLQATDSLASPDWAPVLDPPAIVGDRFVLTIPSDAAARRFFRLNHR
jgi:hypothetical protein